MPVPSVYAGCVRIASTFLSASKREVEQLVVHAVVQSGASLNLSSWTLDDFLIWLSIETSSSVVLILLAFMLRVEAKSIELPPMDELQTLGSHAGMKAFLWV